MPNYEYLVVPAPKKGLKERGVKGPEARFAKALEQVMNEFGAAGWEFQRSDTLPSEERQGIGGKTTTYRTVLVFRRLVEDDLAAFEPELLEPPAPEPQRKEPPVAAKPDPEPKAEEPPAKDRDVAAE